MKISNDIKIEAVDDRNICILKKMVVKGEEQWKRLGYYTTPQGALKGMVNDEIIGTGLKDFQVVCNKIDELYKIIDGLSVKLESHAKNKQDTYDLPEE
ncbi:MULTISPECIES: hypothetical protein [Clostridium]|uniref:hypothetical protein n=1 Tax=Clostridium TaxID=1485 RepID=UPI00069E8500|nr:MULTISPECIES: hypothetical protein [Clostridium]KOF57838.1 hypothetical protein AGR56_16680 [Clostridium sp. DMHC 10]MCD2345066.1 hypothetical protein [Clostridium guangxiense]